MPPEFVEVVIAHIEKFAKDHDRDWPIERKKSMGGYDILDIRILPCDPSAGHQRVTVTLYCYSHILEWYDGLLGSNLPENFEFHKTDLNDPNSFELFNTQLEQIYEHYKDNQPRRVSHLSGATFH